MTPNRSNDDCGTPGVSRATFAIDNATFAFPGPETYRVLSKTLPQGNWVVVATAELNGVSASPTPNYIAACELRNGAGGVIGGAQFGLARYGGTTFFGQSAVTLNGGVAASAGGTEISLWCGINGLTGGSVSGRQMLIWEVGGFF